MYHDLKDFLQDLITNEVMGVDTKTAQALLDSLDNPLSFEDVTELDVKSALRESYQYGEASIEQFWKLNGQRICNNVYESIGHDVVKLSNSYEAIIGDIEI